MNPSKALNCAYHTSARIRQAPGLAMRERLADLADHTHIPLLLPIQPALPFPY